MRVSVGIENNNDGRSIAWALEHPGCFAYGRAADEALANMLPAAREYAGWIRQHGMQWMDAPSLEIEAAETFDAYRVTPEVALAEGKQEPYMVESFFQQDAEPLSAVEVERATRMLSWSREDLLQTIAGLSEAKLNEHYAGERWSIEGILRHIGGAEWWYQERLGAPFPANEADLPEDGRQRLELVRAHFQAWLARQAGVRYMVEHEHEMWSPRKVLRRALWHERDHTVHIRKLL